MTQRRAESGRSAAEDGGHRRGVVRGDERRRAVPGEPYEPPVGRGIPRLAPTDGRGLCSECGHSVQLRRDGLIGSHQINRVRCGGIGAPAAEPMALATWLPVRAGLTPHGLRHGHQTWLDDLGIRYVLQSERMGHEVEGMRGVYSHITPRMRAELTAGLPNCGRSASRRAELPAVAKVSRRADEGITPA
jgi:hypothetical protein